MNKIEIERLTNTINQLKADILIMENDLNSLLQNDQLANQLKKTQATRQAIFDKVNETAKKFSQTAMEHGEINDDIQKVLKSQQKLLDTLKLAQDNQSQLEKKQAGLDIQSKKMDEEHQHIFKIIEEIRSQLKQTANQLGLNQQQIEQLDHSLSKTVLKFGFLQKK